MEEKNEILDSSGQIVEDPFEQDIQYQKRILEGTGLNSNQKKQEQTVGIAQIKLEGLLDVLLRASKISYDAYEQYLLKKRGLFLTSIQQEVDDTVLQQYKNNIDEQLQKINLNLREYFNQSQSLFSKVEGLARLAVQITQDRIENESLSAAVTELRIKEKELGRLQYNETQNMFTNDSEAARVQSVLKQNIDILEKSYEKIRMDFLSWISNTVSYTVFRAMQSIHEYNRLQEKTASERKGILSYFKPKFSCVENLVLQILTCYEQGFADLNNSPNRQNTKKEMTTAIEVGLDEVTAPHANQISLHVEGYSKDFNEGRSQEVQHNYTFVSKKFNYPDTKEWPTLLYQDILQIERGINKIKSYLHKAEGGRDIYVSVCVLEEFQRYEQEQIQKGVARPHSGSIKGVRIPPVPELFKKLEAFVTGFNSLNQAFREMCDQKGVHTKSSLKYDQMRLIYLVPEEIYLTITQALKRTESKGISIMSKEDFERKAKQKSEQPTGRLTIDREEGRSSFTVPLQELYRPDQVRVAYYNHKGVRADSNVFANTKSKEYNEFWEGLVKATKNKNIGICIDHHRANLTRVIKGLEETYAKCSDHLSEHVGNIYLIVDGTKGAILVRKLVDFGACEFPAIDAPTYLKFYKR